LSLPLHLWSEAELAARARALVDVLERERFDWGAHARPEQVEPAGGYDVWCIVSGRGWGKTRTGSETVRGWAEERARRGLPPGHYCVVAKTHREVQAICFEARQAGLVAVFPRGAALYKRSPVMLVLPDGTIIRAFSAEDPDAFRGYAFDGAWLDEYAAYAQTNAQEVFDQVWFCLREAEDPRMIVTTTPKNLPHVRELLDGAHGMRVVITRGHTVDNAANLSEAALSVLTGRYAGTRLGRQELGGELLTDVEDALVQMEWIDRARLSTSECPAFAAVVVGVDPAVSVGDRADETGIVACGVDATGDGYVLADESGRFSPEEWTRRAWDLALRSGAGAVVVEDNQGGDMVESALKTAWFELVQAQFSRRGVRKPARPRIVRVHPSGARQGKWVRAQTIGLLYEQAPGRIHHVTDGGEGGRDDRGRWVRPLDLLEDQLTTWTGGKDEPSPDRVDAEVHALQWLLFPGMRKARGKEARQRVPASSRWHSGRR
jgi:phage terminase large subunit-like protein